jgi:hypothetical protein
MDKELDLYGWIMCAALHKMMPWKTVHLMAGGAITVDTQRMLVSNVELPPTLVTLATS